LLGLTVRSWPISVAWLKISVFLACEAAGDPKETFAISYLTYSLFDLLNIDDCQFQLIEMLLALFMHKKQQYAQRVYIIKIDGYQD